MGKEGWAAERTGWLAGSNEPDYLLGGGKILGAVKHSTKACQWLVQGFGML